MTLLPESKEDCARLLELFVAKIQKINRTSGTVIGTHQLLEMIEQIAIEEGMVECPHCHKKRSAS